MYNEPSFPGLLTLPSNRIAFAAGNSVAACPGDAFNPLWIYGPSGTGKTALLQAMLLRIRERSPDLRLMYIQADDFIRRLVNAIQCHTMAEYRALFTKLDVLVVDHISILEGKFMTQQIAGALLADLVAGGCQVILASAFSPRQLKYLRHILNGRCAYSLQLSIDTPSSRERLDITRQMAQEMNVPLTGSMAIRIACAARSPSHIRCILSHLAARQQLLGADAADLSEVLNVLLRKECVV